MAQFRNLNEEVDKIQKQVIKEKKKEKMDFEKDQIFSSSSDEDQDKVEKKNKKKFKTPKKLKHVYSHKVFKSNQQPNLPAITEEDQIIPAATLVTQNDQSDTPMIYQ